MNRKIFNILPFVIPFIIMIVGCVLISFTFIEYGMPFVVEWLDTIKIFLITNY